MLGRAVPCLLLIVFGALALVAGAVEARFDQDAATPGAATPAPATPIVAGTPPTSPVAGRTVEIVGYDYIPAGVEVATVERATNGGPGAAAVDAVRQLWHSSGAL